MNPLALELAALLARERETRGKLCDLDIKVIQQAEEEITNIRHKLAQVGGLSEEREELESDRDNLIQGLEDLQKEREEKIITLAQSEYRDVTTPISREQELYDRVSEALTISRKKGWC